MIDRSVDRSGGRTYLCAYGMCACVHVRHGTHDGEAQEGRRRIKRRGPIPVCWLGLPPAACFAPCDRVRRTAGSLT